MLLTEICWKSSVFELESSTAVHWEGFLILHSSDRLSKDGLLLCGTNIDPVITLVLFLHCSTVSSLVEVWIDSAIL